ncbi:primosomal protein N' [Verrucomicrobiaceae bacterium N1E253]|uniref:Replication restart protein PriA n=1 Tax=Oceaniferula marina TaxID=2748318 RepID=A0A851GQW9_9BACT|nr:primosomal protein N' [Oceaniferula marina]NWK57377.1 primosomal protein N' [Oceaniferula marina]
MPAARVLIDGPNELVFDYAIPEGMDARPGCRVKIPLRNRASTGTILALAKEQASEFELREVLELIDPDPLITPKLMQMGHWMADYYGAPMELVMRALLPEAVRQENHSEKTRKMVHLLETPDEEAMTKLSKRASRQHLILTLLQAAGGKMPLSDLGAGASASIKAVAKHGWVEIKDEPVRRDPDAGEAFLEDSPLSLNSEQQGAIEQVFKEIETPDKPMLLHGVTGSGKTEIYLQAAQRCLDAGKSVLVLLPEIALAPQTVQRFKSRFASIQDQVAVMHSNLSQGERFDEWHRIRNGEAKIVIGARSAVFAPLTNLGIIIVDEEHENSYKQDTSPRYHGRDLAVLRAHIENSAILLGSATPSLESFHNTETGKYQLLKLEQRADGQSMPIIRIVDMKIEGRKYKGAGPAILSDPLRANMEKKLAEGEQVILFLNRRGFARSLQCPACGLVIECRHCSIPLTYHKSEERLICHICGHQAITPRKCPECHDPGIRFQGYGTEQVEGVLQKVFPTAKLARIDTDTMRRKHALRDTLKAFRQRKIDIIIGTQMIAKGLHFPNVTLVGVLNADLGLHVPDFRAGERTFQLLTQVAGRAGRGELEGEVIVQTYTPHSPSIQFARHHDFGGYADQELEFRRQFGYPPYTHCAVIGTRSTHQRRAEFTLQNIHQRLKKDLPQGMVLGEPLPSPLVRAHGQFRYQLMLLGSSARQLSRHISNILNQTPPPDDVTLVFDMDAMGF